MFLKRYESYLFFGLLIFVCIGLYFYPIYYSPILNFDDTNIILPLKNVTSLNAYWQMLNENVVMDLQPIRDLSYLVEFFVYHQINFINHQLINVLLWIISLGIVRKYFFNEQVSSQNSWMWIFYIATHPVAVNSIAWSSGRKHVLSFFFIALSTKFLFDLYKNPSFKNSFAIIIFYLLSIYSNPINVAWFVFATYILLNNDQKNKSTKLFITLLSIIGIFSAFINFTYYTSELYSTNSFGDKVVEIGDGVFTTRLLILGRYFFQLIFPISPSITSYDLNSPLAKIGIVFLLGASFVIFKLKLLRKENFLWALFFILPLIVVNGPSNHHPGWDIYLLTPLIGWSLFWAFCLNRFLEKRIIQSIFYTIIILNSFQSFSSAKVWSSEERLWKAAIKSENSSYALAYTARYIVNKKEDFNQAWSLISSLSKRSPNHPELGYLLGYYIYHHPIFSSNEKLEMFKKFYKKSPWFIYYFSAFHASQGSFALADDLLNELFIKSDENKISSILKYFNSEAEAITANWYSMCLMAKRNNCTDHIAFMKKHFSKSRFDEKKFQNILHRFH